MPASPPLPPNIDQAAELLAHGGLVAFPTETVYGLGANALDEIAVERIFAAKQRPYSSPLIVHVPDSAAAQRVVSAWPDEAARLADAFWPGPLTLVLPRRAEVPDRVTAGGTHVGVRAPAHPVAQALLRRAGVPVAAPSANRFMQLSPTTAEHVRQGLGDAVDMIVDGGPCPVGIESTVLALYPQGPVLLRPGGIPKARLEQVLGRSAALPPESAPGQAHAAPGMHPRHYSPNTRTLKLQPGTSLPPGHGAVVTHRPRAFDPVPDVRMVAMPEDPAGYARMLYAILHDLDAQGLDWIGLDLPADEDAWQGVRDRLLRAAG